MAEIQGGCDCGEVRYQMEKPIVVHCCHCRWCQRETGASFALNAMIETNKLKLLRGEPEWTLVPSESGAGQSIARCPKCKIAVWSVYLYLQNKTVGMKPIRIVRVGTLDDANAFPPNAHIWTIHKQDWIVLSNEVPAFETGSYDRDTVWSAESVERFRKAFDTNDS